MQKGQILIWIIVGSLVILMAGGAYYLGRSTIPKPSPNPIVTSQTSQSTPSPVDETANWKTYAANKFSFKYPPDYTVEERVKGFHVITPITQKSGFEGISVDSRNTEPLDKNNVKKYIADDLIDPKIETINNGVKISGVFGPPVQNGISLEGTSTIYAVLGYKEGTIRIDTTDPLSFQYFDQILSTFKFL